MLFHTPVFLLFFAVFFLIYWRLRNHLRAQNTLIVIGSFVFYGAWDYRFLALIILSTVSDHLFALGAAGKKVDNRQLLNSIGFLLFSSILIFGVDINENWPYLISICAYAFFLLILIKSINGRSYPLGFVWSSLIINLGLLGVFKYYNFFAESFSLLMQTFGMQAGYVTTHIVLPVGISFYTFQTISYTIDAYRKSMKPSEHLLETCAFVTFFPQLVAGPIERGAHLLPQFYRKRIITREDVTSGAYLFLWGLFKKAVIADNLSVMSDPVFSNPGNATSGELLVALLAFTFQIYCDFSGYSDMARGLAKSLGFSLLVNFDVPYISRTPSEFWSRWHISLSSWLRDYLYIGLGGNRNGVLKTYRNLMLTMLLGGLWHGAAWTFIAWGAFHGFILVIYRALSVDALLVRIQSRNFGQKIVINAGLALLMFFLVCFSWLLFRADSFSSALVFLSGIVAFDDLSGSWLRLGILIAPLWIYDIFHVYFRKEIFVVQLPFLLRFHFVLVVICAAAFLTPGGETAFIYFDF